MLFQELLRKTPSDGSSSSSQSRTPDSSLSAAASSSSSSSSSSQPSRPIPPHLRRTNPMPTMADNITANMSPAACHPPAVPRPSLHPPTTRPQTPQPPTLSRPQIHISTRNDTRSMSSQPNPNVLRHLPHIITVPLVDLGFGVMKEATNMSILYSAAPTQTSSIQISMNLPCNELFLALPVQIPPKPGALRQVEREFRLKFLSAQISKAWMVVDDDGAYSIVITVDNPPLAFRKTTSIRASHRAHSTRWVRQTDIDASPNLRNSAVALQKTDCIIDLGRWLTYRLKFSPITIMSPAFKGLTQALINHNIIFVKDESVAFTHATEKPDSWVWTKLSQPAQSTGSSLSDLEEMIEESPHLPFMVRYQLEVCLSHGVLLECNIDKDFLKRLSALDPFRAAQVLEKIADRKERYFVPSDIFRLQNQAPVTIRTQPGYCTKIPSVNITPSTMYLNTPVPETSNRVVRHFKHHEDRFLRVRFTDERYKGKIWSCDDDTMNELFTRIKRTMIHGIQIGDRRYDFLAFGNSQFREHGAYFFASTTALTAADIRKWMGKFTHIKAIAKHVSRLGQCFSTTRAIPHKIKLKRIPDIEHNGYCFTDGAGKMSPLLARMIANHFKLPDAEHNYPTAVQFRLAGCKGVLAVDPALKGMTIQIRPSQEKFPADFQGLEVCRISQFGTANLNMQIILVLSALGVPDEVFLGKMRVALQDLKEAMTDEKRALDLLQKNVDYNQVTIAVASMIFDGFMEINEPFFNTALRLWRSWCLKYLKEKARIYIERGFFGLGVPDETGTLKGHFRGSDFSDKPIDDVLLPEVFLQVPDPEFEGRWRVVIGPVIFARNPSLHPGDVRVCNAVDVLVLHHHRNVVVVPTTGDRDLANMCSGGDLDGDDFMVIWDYDIMPREVNHPPMDYISPNPEMAKDEVTVDEMTTFFVKHIKNDNLAKIAVAHRYWADQLADGIKDEKCIQLAQLHSKAVDYPKTGIPATVSDNLKVTKWPHWSEPRNRAQSKIYKSNRILGQLYDEVKKEPFLGAWDLPFDDRILTACDPTEKMMQDARQIKSLYDDAVRRIMAQHGIKTEFEVWTTFVLEHHQEISDYKFAETLGEIRDVLFQTHAEMCFEKAGTDPLNKDWEKLKPFVVAMYRVTAEEVSKALEDTKKTKDVGGRSVPQRNLRFEEMPLMSFPWIFARELGRIACNGRPLMTGQAMVKPTLPKPSVSARQQMSKLLGDAEFVLPSLPEAPDANACGVVRSGDLLDLCREDPDETLVLMPDLPGRDMEMSIEDGIREQETLAGIACLKVVNNKPLSAACRTDIPEQEPLSPEPETTGEDLAQLMGMGRDESERVFEGGRVEVDFEAPQQNRLDALAALVGMDDDEE